MRSPFFLVRRGKQPVGMFSSKKEITVNTTVQPVMAAADIPNAVANAGIQYTLFGAESMADAAVSELASSIGVKARNAYKWAKDNYYYGIPQANLLTEDSATAAVDAQLLVNYGAGLTKVYYHFGPINLVHYAWGKIIEAHGYDPATNILGTLTASKGTNVYLTDIVPTIQTTTFDYMTAEGALGLMDVWDVLPNSGVTLTNPSGNPGATVTPYVVDPVATDESITVHYEYLLTGVITAGSFVLSLASVEEEQDHHQALVIKADSTRHYFTYQDGIGTYPTIDAVFNFAYSGGGTFFPWIYFRKDFINQGKEPPAEYDINTMFKRGVSLPSDVQQYRDSVKLCKYFGLNFQSMCDAVHQNPDMDDVKQITLMLGVPTKATSDAEREYLFRYFSALYDVASPGVPYGTVGGTGGARPYAQVIRDKAYTVTFSYSGIRRTQVTGTAADVGKYTRISAGVWAHQIDETTYVEVQIYNPSLLNKIQGKYGDVAILDQDEMRVPVDFALIKTMSIVKKQDLLSRAMYLSINTYVETETPWYGSTWFKIVLVVAIVVITVFTGGAAGPGLMAAYTAGVGALAMYIAMQVIISMVIQYAIAAFVDAVGLQNSMFAAIVVVAAAAYASYNGMPAGQEAWGETLTSVSNTLVQETVSAYQDAAIELQEDLIAMAQTYKEKTEALQEKQDAFAAEFNYVDALAYVRKAPMIFFGENPQDFYERTVHAGNIGPSCYTTIRDHAKNGLRLPTYTSSMKLITDSQGTLT